LGVVVAGVVAAGLGAGVTTAGVGVLVAGAGVVDVAVGVELAGLLGALCTALWVVFLCPVFLWVWVTAACVLEVAVVVVGEEELPQPAIATAAATAARRARLIGRRVTRPLRAHSPRRTSLSVPLLWCRPATAGSRGRPLTDARAR
jgi:hypothetical protein